MKKLYGELIMCITIFVQKALYWAYVRGAGKKNELHLESQEMSQIKYFTGSIPHFTSK